jgi:LmbE family N-acetylglucosaminyl deacetylase
MHALLDTSRVRRLLCLGAHCDDIEIGAGGTILRLIEANPQVEVKWVVFGARDDTRRQEARAAAKMLLGGAKNDAEFLNFRDAFMQHDGVAVKETFERIKRDFQPDLILTHHDDDRHQDHRFINQLTWNTWRNHVILEYEIFKYDGDLGRPNVFVPLTQSQVDRKLAVLFESFKSQASKQWFTPDVFLGLMRLRGVECNAASRYAEAFHARKLCL